MQRRKDRPSKFRVSVRIRGRRVSKSFVTEGAALEWQLKMVDERQRSANNLTPAVDTKKTMYAALAEWLCSREDDAALGDELAQSSFWADQARAKHWVVRWGNAKVSEIDEYEVEKALRDILHAEKLSIATRNRQRSLLFAFFKWCIKERYRSTNPVTVDAIEEKRSRQVRPNGVYKELRQVEKYIATAADFSEMREALAEWQCFVGTRVGEICALKHEDIDIERKRARVHGIICHKTGEHKNRTKGQGAGGEFYVPIPDRVMAAYLRLRAGSRYTRPGDYVFTLDGSPLKHKQVYCVHREIISAAKLPYVTPHGLRHSASHMAKLAGLSRDARRELLGQKTLDAQEKYDHDDIDLLHEQIRAKGYGALPTDNVTPIRREQA